MIHLDYDSQFIITADVTERDLVTVVNGLKTINEKTWTFGENWPQIIDVSLMIRRNEGTISSAAAAQVKLIKYETQTITGLKDEAYEPVSWNGTELFREQIADSKFLQQRGSGFIFNEMRTGKALTALYTINRLDAYPALIVSKASNVFEWERQIKLYDPERKVNAISSGMSSTKRTNLLLDDDADYFVISHNLLEKHVSLKTYGGLSVEQRIRERQKGKYELKELDALDIKAVVGDEAHRLSNPKSAVTRALWSVGDSAQSRFALTGTPAPNHIDELWGLLRFCWPEQFPARTKWLNTYVDMRENYFGILECHGLKKENEKYWESVFDTLHVRRVRSRGPKQEFRVLPVEVSPGQKKLAKELAKNCIAETEGAFLTAPEEMSLRHKLSLLACGTPVTDDEGQITALKMPSSKMTALLDVLDESEDQAIVVAVNKVVIKLIRATLEDAGIGHEIFIGGMKKEQQEESVARFQAGESKVIILSSAGAEGIDLPAAKRTIFVQRDYSLVFDLQIENRNTGPGQTAETVEVIDIIAKDTTDETIHAAFSRKEQDLHKLLKTKDFYRRSLGIK